MYKEEKNRLHDVINQESLKIKRDTVKKLKQLVDDFFSRNYQGISENEAKKIKLEFLKKVSNIKISQVEIKYDYQDIIDQIKGNLFLILDCSICRKIEVVSQKEDILLLEPNINGIGIHLKPLINKVKCLYNKWGKK